MQLLRFIRTARHFHPDQIRMKVLYSLRKAKAERGRLPLADPFTLSISPLEFRARIQVHPEYKEGTFTFLNQSHTFEFAPDWNYRQHGALWNYRLNSFEYLQQHSVSAQQGLSLIREFIHTSSHNRTLYNSYCVSQRILNWISFLSRYQIRDAEINVFLWRQAYYLSLNPEYHLRNNHLLDNGFALLRAGLFFAEERFFHAAQAILITELNKQILDDGAHFELSPMYQSIILWRLLESIDHMRTVSSDYSPLQSLLKDSAARMTGWLSTVAFENGELPRMNDCADDGMPPLTSLFDYSHLLGIKAEHRPLRASGLRKFRNRHFELLFDVNGLSPAEAPGHAHADALHFILHVFGAPFIIDTGVSTYEKCIIRQHERSTAAHNTVTVAGKNQSELYGNFRVGRRARILHVKEAGHVIEAAHDGYKSEGVIHKRRIEFHDREIVITDLLEGRTGIPAVAFLHVDKKCGLHLENGRLISKFVRIGFEGAGQIECCDTWHSPAFGVRLPAWEVKIPFSGKLVTRISV